MVETSTEFWQIYKSFVGETVAFRYYEDGSDRNALHYSGAVYEMLGKCEAEMMIQAALRGISVFKAKPDVPRTVFLKGNIETVL